MPITFRGNNVTPLLRQDPGHPTSLFQVLQGTNPVVFAGMTNAINAYRRDGSNAVQVGGVRYLSVLKLFDSIIYSGDSALDDKVLIDTAYTVNAAAMIAATGQPDAASFMESLNSSIDASGPIFQSGLDTLANESFPATYQYKDIAYLLTLTRVTQQTVLTKQRLFETAYIMNRIINRQRFVAATLMLAHMHNVRFASYCDRINGYRYYNQGAITYTLLTFSFLVARAATLTAEQQTSWYFLWRALGSLLGLANDLVPHDRTQSNSLWNSFQASSYTSQNYVRATQLNRVYDAALAERDTLSVLRGLYFITSMKGQYLRQKAYWWLPGSGSWLWSIPGVPLVNRLDKYLQSYLSKKLSV